MCWITFLIYSLFIHFCKINNLHNDFRRPPPCLYPLLSLFLIINILLSRINRYVLKSAKKHQQQLQFNKKKLFTLSNPPPRWLNLFLRLIIFTKRLFLSSRGNLKMNIQCFCLHFANSKFYVIFSYFLFITKSHQFISGT